MPLDDLAERAASETGARIPAVVAAFVALFRNSWPGTAVASHLEEASRERSGARACRQLLAAFDAAYAEHPTASFWWKDEVSHFLGFCPRLAAGSGLSPRELLGRTDADPAVVWCRQGALYMKDDREVLKSGEPRFDIVERQDRDGGTVWLRTSKVPYTSDAGSGTVGGFDIIDAVHARELAKRRR